MRCLSSHSALGITLLHLSITFGCKEPNRVYISHGHCQFVTSGFVNGLARRTSLKAYAYLENHLITFIPSHLDSGLWKPQPLTQFLSHEGIWIVSLIKESLQLIQLFQSEVGAAPPLFDLWVILLRFFDLHCGSLVTDSFWAAGWLRGWCEGDPGVDWPG